MRLKRAMGKGGKTALQMAGHAVNERHDHCTTYLDPTTRTSLTPLP
ncbi:hypothetical protein [uncultured Roseobacter sp.]|nr:hypothetical protein [uncultured Roseobacter sp.]